MINTFAFTSKIFAGNSSGESSAMSDGQAKLSDYMLNSPAEQNSNFASLLSESIHPAAEGKGTQLPSEPTSSKSGEKEKPSHAELSGGQKSSTSEDVSSAHLSQAAASVNAPKEVGDKAEASKKEINAKFALQQSSAILKDQSKSARQVSQHDSAIFKKEKDSDGGIKKSLAQGLHSAASALAKTSFQAAAFAPHSLAVQEQSSTQKFLRTLHETFGIGAKKVSLAMAQSKAEIKDEKVLLLSKTDALKKIIQDILLGAEKNPSKGWQSKKSGMEANSLLQEKNGQSKALKNKPVAHKPSVEPTHQMQNNPLAAETLVGNRLNVSRETSALQKQGGQISEAQSFARNVSWDKGESSSLSQRHSSDTFGGQQNPFLFGKTSAETQKTDAFRAPLMQKQFEGIMQRARLNVKENGNARFTTSMYPAELGKVSVYLSMTDGVVFGRFTVENELVRSQLMEHLQNLSETFRQDGLTVSGFEVDVKDNSHQARSQESHESKSPLRNGSLSAGEEFKKQQAAEVHNSEGGIYA